MPPKGSEGFFRTILPTLASLSNNSPSTMETDQILGYDTMIRSEGVSRPSSMIKTFVFSHRITAFLFFLTLSASFSAVSIPRPIPANECIVIPPMLQAAIPVNVIGAHVQGRTVQQVLTCGCSNCYHLRRPCMNTPHSLDNLF